MYDFYFQNYKIYIILFDIIIIIYFYNYIYYYFVHAVSFCWFLNHEEIKAEIEDNYEHFSSAMLHVFRASNLTFCEEYELEEARTFSKKILEKIVSMGKGCLLHQIEHELSFPWFARLDHLEHRMWLEETEANVLWKGKTSYNRYTYYAYTDFSHMPYESMHSHN